MAVDRVKELVQDGLRRKLSGDLKGAAEAWAEALKLDPTNKRAREGLDALRAQGIEVPKFPTPALGLVLEPSQATAETVPPKKNPFARPAAPSPFNSTPSPFPGESSATPLSLLAPGEAPRVSAATPPPVPAPVPATPPTGTMVFGATGAPTPTLPPTPPQADTLSFGGPELPAPPFQASPGEDFDLGADFNDPTPPIATPALGSLPFDPEPASTLVFGLSEHASVPPPTPGLPPLPFESESGASLIFGLGAAASATPSTGTMVFGEKPPAEPTSTLVFGCPAAPVESSGTMVFGGPAAGLPATSPDPTGTLVFGGPASPAPAEPSGTMVFGKLAPTGAPAVPPSGTMVFGGPAPGPIPGSALDPASTLMFGIKGPLPAVQTDPFGKAASPGLVRSLELDVEDDGPALIGSDPPLPNPFSLPKIAPTPPSEALRNGPLVEPEPDDVVELYLDEPQGPDEPLVPPSPPQTGPVPLPKGSLLAPLPPPPSEPLPGPSFIPQTMTGSFEVDLGDDLVPAERVVQRLVPPPAPPAPPAAAPPPARPTTDPSSLGPLLLKATDLLDLDDHTGAMAVVEKILALDPSNATAHELKARCEGTLLAMYESKLGDLSRRPTLKIKPDEVVWLNLDHRAGFLLSLIDGQVSLDDLFSLSSMSRLDTARILHQLVTDKVIG